ncbi:hypothetical protein HPP92_025546 [Vanilla planifolia]|uniref:Serpin domain-containing protein n=1 Tax=Vanilla planifolia TaxID=51239 RepID=A0A835PJS2_VANPL|nr:hypothetical protein HPP92_025546 [Vanilla planifolia]
MVLGKGILSKLCGEFVDSEFSTLLPQLFFFVCPTHRPSSVLSNNSLQKRFYSARRAKKEDPLDDKNTRRAKREDSAYEKSSSTSLEGKIDGSCLSIAEHVGLWTAARGTNFVFSPLSIHAALTLLSPAAYGETLQQLQLFFKSSSYTQQSSTISTTESGSGAAGLGPRMAFVNGVWVDRSLSLKPSFNDYVASHGAVIKPADFKKAPRIAEQINEWVKKASHGTITELIPAGHISRETRLVLCNALYFNLIGAKAFDKSMTEERKFHLLDGRSVQVPFMSSKEEQFVSIHTGFKVLRLPYTTGSLSLLVFLPDEIDGIASLTAEVISNPGFISSCIPGKASKIGRFMIPKFKMSFGFDASQVLRTLGVEVIFCPRADFRGMCLRPNDARGLFVSCFEHKVGIEVNEEGSSHGSVASTQANSLCDFVADHPFLFVVRDESTENIWLFGYVVDPSL